MGSSKVLRLHRQTLACAHTWALYFPSFSSGVSVVLRLRLCFRKLSIAMGIEVLREVGRKMLD